MSEFYLPLGLIGIFLSVFLAVVLVQSVVAQRRRAVEVLRSQVREIRSTNLREEQLGLTFGERVVIPLVSGLGTLARRVTPQGMLDRITHKLVLAGSPQGWDAPKVAAFKFAAGLALGALGLMTAIAVGVRPSISIAMVVLSAGIGYLLPGAFLGQQALNRQETIRRALPDTMDLLTISVEAGLGFDAALAHVRKSVPGALSQEISRLLQEMQLGVSRQDAFRHLGERTDVEELKAFILAMLQADTFGISIAKVLRSQARELRIKRRQRAEERAMKIPVKLLFPLIFCILPAMFVVIIGPGAIGIFRELFQGGIF